MTITLTIDDTVAPTVIADYARARNYQETIMGSPNPESKGQFVKRLILQHIKDTVREVRVKDTLTTIGEETNSLPIS